MDAIYKNLTINAFNSLKNLTIPGPCSPPPTPTPTPTPLDKNYFKDSKISGILKYFLPKPLKY